MLRVTLITLALVAGKTAGAPNIVLFLVDDLGWRDVLVPKYRTPNVERLAREGMRFTDAYASAPVCTPTRTSIMTGQCPGRTRITYWTLHRDRDTSRRHPTLDPPAWRVNGLDPGDVTIAELLRDAGYRTIHAGKAHFGAHGTPCADPRNVGFDVNIAGHGSGAPASYYGKKGFAGEKPSVWDVPGLEAYHGREIYLTEALTLEAVKAVRVAVADDKPFFLHFAPYAVHTPIMANPAYLDHYEDLPPREAAYATMIESVDVALGVLLDLLDELDVAGDTLVVFTSDNGGLSAHARDGTPHTHNTPLRSGKGSAYEGGIRVPLVMRWPGRISPGVSSVPVVSHDLFPTFAAAAGIEASSVDGRDLLQPDANRVIVWHQPHQWGADGPGIEPFTAIRVGTLKLIWFHAGPRLELYDLAADIGETTDLAERRPDDVRRLADLLDRWFVEAGAQRSRDHATGTEIEGPS